MPQCYLKSCKNRSGCRPRLGQVQVKNINNLSYHRFPKEEKLRLRWINVLNLNEESIPPAARLCSVHFSKNAFYTINGQRRLRSNALPCTEYVFANISHENISHDNDVPSTSCNISKIESAALPIPEKSHTMHQPNMHNISPISTNMPPIEENSFLREYFQKKLQDTRTVLLKKIKGLQQQLRRKESKISSLKAILDKYREKDMLGTEELQHLQDIDEPNSKILER